MGITTKFTAMQAGEALGILAQQGFTAESSMKALPGILNLAAAADLDLASAATYASDNINTFNLGAAGTERVADSLNSAAVRTSASVVNLAEAMKNAGNLSESLNISLEDTLAMVGAMSQKGIRGGRAGNALAMAMFRLSGETGEVKKALTALGIDLEKFKDKSDKIKFKELLTAIEKTGASTDKISHIFGARGKDILAIFQSIDEKGRVGMESVNGLAQEIRGDLGRAAKMAKANMETFDGSMIQLNSAFLDLKISMGNAFLRPLQAIVDWMTTLTRSIVKFNEKTDNMIGRLALVGSGFTAILVTLRVLPTLIHLVGASLITLTANPIGAIVTAAGLAATAFVVWQDEITTFAKKFDELTGISSYFAAAYESMVPRVTAALSAVKSYVFSVFSSIKSFIESNIRPAVTYIVATFRTMLPTIQSIGTAISTYFGNRMD
jgi:TP901 family phage tail tape measure protein